MDKKEKLLKDKKEIINDLFCFIGGLLLFPITGLAILCCSIVECIIELHDINKNIKEEKIKEIITKDLVIFKDDNGNIKEIKF